MAIRIQKTDLELLRHLAEYRMLLLEQLAFLLNRKTKAVSRRLNQLREADAVQVLWEVSKTGRGRQPNLYGLGNVGVKLLQDYGLVPDRTEDYDLMGEHLRSQHRHQILQNWFRLHLVHIERTIPPLSASSLSCNSPFAIESDSGHSLLRDHVTTSVEPKQSDDVLEPDVAFSLCDETSGKSLLFFVEIDTDSEPVRRGNPHQTDISTKISRYGAYFRSKGYKRYEDLLGGDFKGFRLLILTTAQQRLESLARFLRGLSLGEFIWIAQEKRLFEEGAGGFIWLRGGDGDLGEASILGKFGAKNPITRDD